MFLFFKVSAVLILTLVPLATASAQGYGNGPMGGGGGLMGPGRFILDPANLPALKTKLAITSEQEPQWAAYSKEVSNVWETRQAMRQSMQDQPMTQAERQEVRTAHQEAGTEIRAELQKSRNALSAALTPEQRNIFDQETPALPENGLSR